MPKEFFTTIIVNQKPEFSDPRAQKLQKQLNELGLSVKNVKVGKRFEIKQHAENISQITEAAGKIAEKLLVNPVVEEATEIFVLHNKI
jgi:phosphoribosylformylglycinamidine synthase PurS subunit